MTSGGIAFVKGHGTENDFVLLPDGDALLELTDARVRALCDRRAGIGGDGVLRVVRAAAVSDRPSGMDEDLWFMDYRNADGSVAEMCGNGIRVFARYLVESGLVAGAGDVVEFTVGSRAGARAVRVDAGGAVTVDMGPARVTGESAATLAGRSLPGVAVDVGNPHLVCVLDPAWPRLADLDLTVPPGHDATRFPDGVNVEFVAADAPDRLRLRVHERGVGETRSCGTGTVAAVAAVLHRRGAAAGTVGVTVPGGQVRVTVDGHGGTSTLTGPAVLVGGGEIDRDWWLSR